MKKVLLGMTLMLGLPAVSHADIKVTLPADAGIKNLVYYHNSIDNLVNGKSRQERSMQPDSVAVVNNTAVITIDAAPGGSRYGMRLNDDRNGFVSLYALPGEDITVNVTSLQPLDVKMAGSPHIETVNEIDALTAPIEAKMAALSADGQPDQEKVMALYSEYNQAIQDYIEENLTSPAVVTALMSLDGEDFVNRFDRLSESAKTSFLYPLAQQQYDYIKKNLEQERMQAELANGTHDAPGFTLKNLEGKDVSLSEFKGKWVILDFWGSWCIWCIKGFPELKEAYAKYAPELEIIGIDCNEDEAAWRKGVEKYELKWVNVYNPKDSGLLEKYGVQGFPTKAIVNPEGKLVNITTGHNPEFFTILSTLMGK